MRKELIGLLAIAAVVLGAAFLASPNATTTTNAASTGALGIDIWGLTKTAEGLPDQDYPAH